MDFKGDDSVTIVNDKNHIKYSYVPDTYGHLSHFRKQLNFPYKIASISTLILDLNYLNCFFVPAFEKFSKN
jgi:hypothetical protein